MSIEPVLRWAANQVGAGASVVAVKRLRAGGGPWRLRIDRGGTPLEVVLRVGDPAAASGWPPRRRRWRSPKTTS
jgi:hypothetical protein